MVTSVYGDIEGHRIIFSLSEGNFWQATIPAVPTGEYVTALYCEDDAGNVAYYGTVLYVVDVESMTWSVKMLEYAADAGFGCAGFHIEAAGFRLPDVERIRWAAEIKDYHAAEDADPVRYHIASAELKGRQVYYFADNERK